MFKYRNIDINYVRYGNINNQTVVLLHGWGQNIEMMKPVGDSLIDNDVIIVDLPGHGKSEEPKEIWSLNDFVDMIHELLTSLNVQNPSEEVQTFLKGYQMIFDQLMAILKKNGVEVIEAQGKEFDPNLHQAVMTTQDDQYGHNIVVEELQKGYKLKDRVIRASLVKVNE